MPYIKQEKRDVLDPSIDALHRLLVDLELDDDANNMEGNINYIFTRILRKCYGNSYAEINDAMGILNSVTHEFYRVVAAPYENQKQFENGDVETGEPTPEEYIRDYHDGQEGVK
jgi:hypothetical protein